MNSMFEEDDPEFNEFMMQFLTDKQGREPIESFGLPLNGNKDQSLRKQFNAGNKPRMNMKPDADMIVGKTKGQSKAPPPEYLR